MMTLKLDVFEGPLDLLLQLIKKDNLSISRVSIAAITGQYLEAIENMASIDIDVASDFLSMAAELAFIKSKSILPNDRSDTELEEADESADSLVAKLKRYQHFKSLAAQLAGRTLLGRDVLVRGSLDFGGSEEIPEETAEKPMSDEWAVTSYELVRAFHSILNRLPKLAREHRVQAERVSITERVYEILDELRRSDGLVFENLFAMHTQRIDAIVTFLALLEMAKLRMISVVQENNYGPIRIRQRVVDESENISGAEPDKILTQHNIKDIENA